MRTAVGQSWFSHSVSVEEIRVFQVCACVVCFENHAEWRICLFSVTWQVPVETCMSVSRDRRTSCAVLRVVAQSAQCALVERSFPFVFSSQL